jgi:hypothetical protein
MKITKLPLKAIFLLGLLAAVSCSQDAIFYGISKETAPKDPRIKGSPTNMVMFTRTTDDGDDVKMLCVASGKIHWYAKPNLTENVPAWDKGGLLPQPGGRVIALAATDDRMYALCMTGHGVDTVVRYIGKTDKWTTISTPSNYPLIQSIYTANGHLFAGARKNDSTTETYAILRLDTTTDPTAPRFTPLAEDNIKMLTGAIYDGSIYYLSTKSGIYTTDLSAAAPLSDLSGTEDKDRNDNRIFVGIIKLENTPSTIIAVERDGGKFYEVKPGGFELMKYTDPETNDVSDVSIATGSYATGALVLWEATGTGMKAEERRKMLIAGVQGSLYNTTTSSYSHGYVEFDLDENGSLHTASKRRDPGKLESVDDNDRYAASLDKYPINHLFQAPEEIDIYRTFFASTQTAGLWSYRDRSSNGGWQWNAEE